MLSNHHKFTFYVLLPFIFILMYCALNVGGIVSKLIFLAIFINVMYCVVTRAKQICLPPSTRIIKKPIFVLNSFIPFGNKYAAITILKWVFIKSKLQYSYWFKIADDATITDMEMKSDSLRKLINHESIHYQQILETSYILFYILYGIDWVYKYFKLGNIELKRGETVLSRKQKAYYYNCFEIEAYLKEAEYDYITVMNYNWFNYFLNTSKTITSYK